MRPIVVILLWALFTVACVAGWFAGVVALMFGALMMDWGRAGDYAANLFKSMDRVTAALFGFDGRHTLSAECGGSTCRPCKALCAVLAWMLREPRHCEDEHRNQSV